MPELKKVTVYGSIVNAGDGSAYVKWFLTEAEAVHDQETQYDRFAEDCIEEVETFEGSNIHKDAVKGYDD